MTELAKIYDPQSVEKEIYRAWEESGYFNPDVCITGGITTEGAERFSIVLPPPNVTGILHTGHAAMLAIEDTMVRYHRMKGDRTLWLPGTDHAAIATQSKVEKLLHKETGQSRYDLGREAFLARVEKFAQDSYDTIVNQCRAMGASLDWSREAFTLDPPRHRAVVEAFRRMYNDSLIYRGDRIVNWDPKGQTTVSDDEVLHEERTATLYTFRYSKDFPIAISTTRPETKVGDTAVAVHPDDERYARYIGKTFKIDDFCGTSLTIRIIADPEVAQDFGTGALGVTPAHSHIDWEMSERHNLPRRRVINEDARMTEEAGPYLRGKTTTEARERVVQWLRDNDLLEGEETITQSVSVAERTGGIIEPLPKKQWFVAVNKPFERDGKKTTLKELIANAVKSGAIDIIPQRFEKIYFHWIDNLRDWCISRQIWYGHRIPVWYRGNEIVVSEHAPDGDGWKQDPDTLDTWFSSGLWTFSTLGWPDDTPDFRTYHPTNVLETGYDILFFWVARMILMSTYLIGDVPFRTVYLHGLIRDEKGRKMSKSLGNAIDPLDVSVRYGTDAVRLSLLIGSTPGQDMRLGKEKIAGYRNFTNKLWNIGRYVLSQDAKNAHIAEARTPADHWILAHLQNTVATVTEHLEKFRFSQAGEVLRDFTWNDFADWYIEAHKIERNDALLHTVFRTLLHLWHPFMPFVTEELFTHIKQKGDRDFLMVSQWPQHDNTLYANIAQDDVMQFDILKDLIAKIRALRALYNITPDKKPLLTCDTNLCAIAAKHKDIIMRLGRVADVIAHTNTTPPRESAALTTAHGTGYLLLEGLVDTARERERLSKEIAELTENITAKQKRLSQESFVTRAPQDVVAKEKALLAEAQKRVTELHNARENLT